jgi:hypothetical protein
METRKIYSLFFADAICVATTSIHAATGLSGILPMPFHGDFLQGTMAPQGPFNIHAS